jgi:integrase
LLFRQKIVRWLKDGKRVPAGTPGAVKKTTQSRKYYADVPDGQGGHARTPLAANKAAALAMLGDLLKDGAGPAWRRWAKVPLARHLDDFGAALASGLSGKGGRAPCAQHAGDVLSALRSLLLGRCGVVLPGELTLPAVREALAAMARPARPLPELPPPPGGRAGWTLSEAAGLLGVRPCSLYLPMQRYGVVGAGPHARRLYTREQVLTLAQRQRGRRGLSPARLRYAALHARRFSAWMAAEGRLPRDVLAGLKVPAAAEGERHGRRPLGAAELAALLGAALASRRTLRGLSGADRHHLYLVALSTGLRRSELARLTPAHFRLDAPTPHAVLPGSQTKNGQPAAQPLPAAVAAALRAYLRGRAPAAPVWPGPGWVRDAPMVLRRDLADAGVACFHAAPEGDLFADFHGLRHTFIALLDRAGVTLKQAMQLARHSDPRLTAKVYGRATLAELAAAAEGVGQALVTDLVTGGRASQDQPGSRTVKNDQGGSGMAGRRKPRAGKAKRPGGRKAGGK